MLSGFTPMTTLPTVDMERAKAFYEGLGFAVVTDDDKQTPGGVMFQSGDGFFMVYQSAFAGTNQATAMGFMVPGDAFDDTVAFLRQNGISFDTFEMDGAQWDDDVLTWESLRNVWFRDPDGNILSVGTTG